MKKPMKIALGITGVLALMEFCSTCGEIQAFVSMAQAEPEATERVLDSMSNKELHKDLGVDPVTSGKCRFLSWMTRRIEPLFEKLNYL